LESVIEQYEGIIGGARTALAEGRPSDAAGWLDTPVEALEVASVSAPPAGKPGMIYAKLIEAMRLIEAVEKDGEYSEGGTHYKFRSVDGTVRAVGPALRKAGVIPIPLMRGIKLDWGTTARGTPRRQVIVQVTYRFTAEDGSYVDVEMEVESFNMSDKGVGVAMSVAYRVALLQLFCIPTGDPDPDASYPETGTAPRLSKPLVAYLLDGIRTGALESLEALWKLLVAHAPGDSRVPDEETERVWWEIFAERYGREVEARTSKDELAALWKALGGFGLGFLVGGGRSVADLIKDRNAMLVRQHQVAMEEIRDLLAAASDEAEVAHAVEVVKAHLKEGRINGQDSLAWLERADKLREQIKVSEAERARAAMDDDAPAADPDELPTHEGR
jgi:ERF superfamily